MEDIYSLEHAPGNSRCLGTSTLPLHFCCRSLVLLDTSGYRLLEITHYSDHDPSDGCDGLELDRTSSLSRLAQCLQRPFPARDSHVMAKAAFYRAPSSSRLRHSKIDESGYYWLR